MNKFLAAFFMIGVMQGGRLPAQDSNQDSNLFNAINGMDTQTMSTPAPSPAAKPGENPSAQQEPTIITATDKSTFESKTKTAVLYGDVHVKNPQFTLRSDKLTVYFHKNDDDPKTPGAKKPASPSPSPTPKPSPSPASKPGAPGPDAEQGGGIDMVIAEGNVDVECDRPGSNGGAPVHYTGKCEKLIYTPATGEAVLSGWPKLTGGTNTMSATDNLAVIHLNREGTMHAEGHVEMVVQNPPPDKPTPTPEKTPEVKLPELR